MYRASALFYGIFFNQIVNNIDILTDYLDENYDFITNGETYHYLTKKDFKIIVGILYLVILTGYLETDYFVILIILMGIFYIILKNVKIKKDLLILLNIILKK